MFGSSERFPDYRKSIELGRVLHRAWAKGVRNDLLRDGGLYKVALFTPSPGGASLSAQLDAAYLGRFEYLCGEVDGHFTVIFLLGEEDPDASSRYIDEMGAAISLRPPGEGRFDYNSSMVVTGPELIPEAYAQALDELFFNCYTSKRCHMERADEQSDWQYLWTDMLFLGNITKTMNLALRAGQKAKFEALLGEVTEHILYTRPYRLEDVVRRIQITVNSLVDWLKKDAIFEDDGAVRRHALTLLITAKDEAEFRSRANTLIRELYSVLEGDRLTAASGRYERIKVYIDASLSDPNLCVTQIADEFGVSNNTVSTGFKQEFGVSVFDYIHKGRISIATKLLESSAMPLSGISAAAGYGSVNTMYRSFKKYQGGSPSGFRRSPR